MKKVLIVGYYFPPAGGPGVQRWLKFVKYLPDFGIEPVMYVPENPTYPILDQGLMAEVPSKLTVVKKRIFEPYALASVFSKGNTRKISSGIIPNERKQSLLQKFMLWVRGNLFIPDARVFWVKPSVKFLQEYLTRHQIDTIITTGPPHSLHLIGLQLKQKMNVRWIADFRDPWTTIGYHKDLKLSAASAQKHLELESRVLQSADHIIVTSPTTQREFQALTTKPVTVITNGYDVENVGKRAMDEKFSLAHIGSFLSQRNPRILWKALRELVKEHKDFAAKLEIKLAGKVSQEVLDTIAEFRLDGFVRHLGYLSHEDAVKEQRSAQLLLLVEIDRPETRCIIPGKLFEYMASERPIIALGPEGADMAQILRETNTGSFFLYDEKEPLKSALLESFRKFQDGTLQSHAVGLQKYLRRNLTGELATLLKS